MSTIANEQRVTVVLENDAARRALLYGACGLMYGALEELSTTYPVTRETTWIDPEMPTMDDVAGEYEKASSETDGLVGAMRVLHAASVPSTVDLPLSPEGLAAVATRAAEGLGEQQPGSLPSDLLPMFAEMLIAARRIAGVVVPA